MSKDTQITEREIEETKPELCENAPITPNECVEGEPKETEPAKGEKASKGLCIGAIVCGIVAIAVAAICVPKLIGRQSTASGAADGKYNITEQDAYSNVYEKFVELGQNKGYERSHTKNDILVTVDKVKEVEVLEVLDVCAADVKEYKFDNELTDPTDFFHKLIRFVTEDPNAQAPPQAVVWLEGSCIGTYEVDLKASEIIVDSVNKYVLVRLPSPSLRFISHDFEVKYFNNGTRLNKILDGSTPRGLDAAIQDTADMTAHLHEMLNNREHADLAREQAETLVEGLIKDLNTGIDVEVDVEFFG